MGVPPVSALIFIWNGIIPISPSFPMDHRRKIFENISLDAPPAIRVESAYV
jgi:hypothetical protein